MGSPIDRTNKTALDANLVNGVTSDAPKLKASNDTVYNYVDTLNSGQDAHAGAATLAHPDGSVTTAKLANGSVTTAKIADGAVTAAKVADGSLTAGKFVAGVLSNETANGLQIVALQADNTSRAINVLYPPAPLVAADKTGVTDSTVAIQAALTSLTSGGTLIIPPGTYKITDTLNVPSNVVVEGVGDGTVIKLSSGDMSGFLVASKTNVTIRDLKITCAVAGTTVYIGGVKLQFSSRCLVENVKFEGLTWAGVLMVDSSYNIVQGCRFDGWLGTASDSADICLYQTCNYNRVEGNYCYGGGQHGIFIQDPYNGDTPTGNVIIGNQVGEHKTYGIAIYVTTAYDTKTVIANNVVKDIQGSEGAGGSGGSGIYVQSAGGTIVTGNQVSNCGVQTTNFETNGVGHIAVSIWNYGAGTITEVIVANNHINAPRGPGIFCATSNKGIIVKGNTILVTGTTAIRGEGIYAFNCLYLKILDNIIRQANPNYAGIGIVASDFEVIGTEIGNNSLEVSAIGISFNPLGTGTFTDPIMTGNQVYGGSSTALFMQKASNALLSNNNLKSSNGAALSINACPKLRLTANRLYGANAGVYSIVFVGSSTGSVVDESNILAGTVENDPGSGVVISQYANAAPPGSGSWEVGDRVIQSNPAVGNPKGWRCTVAGTPGTWVSEGNL